MSDASVRHRPRTIAFVAMIGLAVLARCGSESPPAAQQRERDTSQQLTGTVSVRAADSLTASGDYAPGSSCIAAAGYDDIRVGATVVVEDADKRTIGTGRLADGHVGDVRGIIGNYIARCDFTFVITDLPRSDFYSVGVGSRGSTTFSRSELESNDWDVELTLR